MTKSKKKRIAADPDSADKQYTMTLPPDMRARLDQHADARGVATGSLIKMVLHEWLQQQVAQDVV